eukprot:scaffold2780_cov174-Amphora_coffeaeformis.AAC.2
MSSLDLRARLKRDLSFSSSNSLSSLSSHGSSMRAPKRWRSSDGCAYQRKCPTLPFRLCANKVAPTSAGAKNVRHPGPATPLGAVLLRNLKMLAGSAPLPLVVPTCFPHRALHNPAQRQMHSAASLATKAETHKGISSLAHNNKDLHLLHVAHLRRRILLWMMSNVDSRDLVHSWLRRDVQDVVHLL